MRLWVRRDTVGALAAAEAWVAEARPGTAEARAALLSRAEAAFNQGTEQAERDYQELVRQAEAADDTLMAAHGYSGLGKHHGRLDQLGKAYQFFTEAWQRFQQVREWAGEVSALNGLANLHSFVGEQKEAVERFAQALELARLVNRPDLTSRVLNNLAIVERDLGHFEQARARLEEAIAYSRETEDLIGEAHALFNLAMLEVTEGKPQGVEPKLERVMSLREQAGDQRGAMTAMLGGASAAAGAGQVEEANRLWNEAITKALAAGAPEIAARAILHQVEVALPTEGGSDRVGELLDRVQQLMGEAVWPRVRFDWRKAQAEWAERRGQLDLALAAFKEMRQLEQELHSETTRRRLEILEVRNKLEVARAEAAEARQRSDALATALADAERQRERAEEANRFQSDMVRTAAHDLRTPFQSVVGFLDLAQEDLQFLPSDHPVREFIREAQRTADRAVQTLDRLLDPALAQAGKLIIRAEWMDVAEITHEIVRDVRVTALAKQQQVKVQAEAGTRVHADRVLIGEALQNLLSNAIKYGPRGQIITVRAVRRATWHRWEVTDEGPGLTAEQAAGLWQSAQVGTARPTAGETSHGLGLSIVRSIVQAHDGRVGADSPGPRQGSTFWIELPAAD